jgi:hypothetical protein
MAKKMNMDPSRVEYIYEFIRNGCTGILRKWVLDGFIIRTGEIALLMEQSKNAIINSFNTKKNKR